MDWVLRRSSLIHGATFFIYLAFLVQIQVFAADNKSIQDVFEKGGTGKFKCAYKSKVASKPCEVSVQQETVTDPRLLAISSPGDKRIVLNILWADGDKSSYMQSDSGEMINLLDQNDMGYRIRGIEQGDWRKGLVLDRFDYKGEYIRIW